MINCDGEFDTNNYNKPTQVYELWAKEKLDKLQEIIETKLGSYKKPTVIVLEIGHFSLPKEQNNLNWAYQNIDFANTLCKQIIQKYKSKHKIIPTLLVNNLDSDEGDEYQKVIDDMLKNKKYINAKSLKIISERNLKNRAFKALKNNINLEDTFIRIDGKAYLKDDEYQHDLAAGFVNDNGDIIPRCGLILTSFLEMVSKLAKERLHQNKDINILFISFSQEFHEYKRVMLGVDIYAKQHTEISIDPLILHFSYEQDQCLVSFKSSSTKTWQDKKL